MLGVVELGINVAASLEQQDLQPLFCELFRSPATRHARTNHYCIVVFCCHRLRGLQKRKCSSLCDLGWGREPDKGLQWSRQRFPAETNPSDGSPRLHGNRTFVGSDALRPCVTKLLLQTLFRSVVAKHCQILNLIEENLSQRCFCGV